MSTRFEIASHVFTVEFHVYIFHLIDVLPDYDLPKLHNGNSGWSGLELEDLEVHITKNDGTIQKYSNIKFPKRFSSVLDFYLFDADAIFFPSYEFHTLSKNGVVLKNAVLQSSRHGESISVTTFVPELMLNIELNDIRTMKWRTSSGNNYIVDLTDVDNAVSIARSPSLNLTRKPIHLPNGIDLRPLCPPIKNQGDLGTCGAAAVTTFLEFVVGCKLSILYLYYTTRVYVNKSVAHDDAGVELPDILESLSRHGICTDETWPYISSRFLEEPSRYSSEEARRFRPQLSDFQPLNSLEEMKASLKREMPFFIDINFAPSAYGREPAATGKVGKPPIHEVEYCDHSVLVIGYNDETEELKFQNSWGAEWGEQGFGYVSYEYITRGLFKNGYTWKSDKLTNVF